MINQLNLVDYSSLWINRCSSKTHYDQGCKDKLHGSSFLDSPSGFPSASWCSPSFVLPPNFHCLTFLAPPSPSVGCSLRCWAVSSPESRVKLKTCLNFCDWSLVPSFLLHTPRIETRHNPRPTGTDFRWTCLGLRRENKLKILEMWELLHLLSRSGRANGRRISFLLIY